MVASLRFDLIIASMETGGLRGPDLARAIRHVPGCHDLPIILMSSDDNPVSPERSNNVGFQAFVRKGSFRHHDLIDAARALLAGRATADKHETQRSQV
jgi:CheY-like chemotaxis protein